jgi:hypothetical protein
VAAMVCLLLACPSSVRVLNVKGFVCSVVVLGAGEPLRGGAQWRFLDH